MNPKIKSSINPQPLAPALDDAPTALLIIPAFYRMDQWRAWTLCFPVQTRIKMQAAWWKLELWSQAVRQNLKGN